jgi:hypothetical protein
MKDRDLLVEMNLAKAWNLMSENIVPYDDGVKDAEVVGKASPLEKINGVIYNIINSEKAQQLILRRIETCIAEMFYEHLALGKEFISEYDLTKALKQMIGVSIPNLENYLTKIDEELEYATDYYSILNDKIAELAEIHTPTMIQKYHQIAKKKNAK